MVLKNVFVLWNMQDLLVKNVEMVTLDKKMVLVKNVNAQEKVISVILRMEAASIVLETLWVGFWFSKMSVRLTSHFTNNYNLTYRISHQRNNLTTTAGSI